VVTEKGTVHCEHLVNAGGLWAREIGAMAGVYLPLLPMAHQYLVTDDIPEIMDILKSGREFPHVMDPGGESYLRQEGRGCASVLRKALRTLVGGRHALGLRA
jgi:dimethylglycine dehydrogenase